jgi:hypothetical protein
MTQSPRKPNADLGRFFGIATGDSTVVTVGWERVDSAIAPFESLSLLSLLEAAIDSPGCSHRMWSLIILWSRAIRQPSQGVRPATPAHLVDLLNSARASLAVLEELEDTWHLDQRVLVRFSLGQDRLALHPGQLSNPVLALRTIVSVAAAVDAPLISKNGWGLSDLADAALHYEDDRLACLRPHWAAAGLPRDEDPELERLDDRLARIARAPCVLTAEELAASRAFDPDRREWLTRCSRPDRSAKAWDWATAQSEELELTIGSDQSPLGAVLAVRTPLGDRPVPAALVLAGLADAAGRLSLQLADTPHHLYLRHLTGVEAFAMLGEPMDAPTPDETEQAWVERVAAIPTLVAVPARRRAFVVGCAAGLSADTLGANIAAVESALMEIGPDDIRRQGAPFDPEGAIHRIVVYGGPLVLLPATRPGTVRLHVEELTDIVHEAQLFDDDRVPTGWLIWQFFEEAATLPGVARLAALSFDDLWRHWLCLGVIDHTGGGEAGVFAMSAPDDRHWISAGAWERFDALLEASGLPASWTWPTSRLGGERDEATVWRFDEEYTLVLDPPLVVIAVFDKDLENLRIDPSFGIGIADGVRLTIGRCSEIASAVRLADGGPLVLWVRLITEQLPAREDGDGGIGLVLQHEPRPSIGLVCSRDWLNRLANNPTEAHQDLGRRLLDGIQWVRDISSTARDSFSRAWDSAPPVGLLRPYSASLLPRHLGGRLLPRTLATRGRARRRCSTAVLRRQVPPGLYEGRDAIECCRGSLLPSMTEALYSLRRYRSCEKLILIADGDAARSGHAILKF